MCLFTYISPFKRHFSFRFLSSTSTQHIYILQMTAGYRPGSPGRPGSSRPGSPGVHTKVEEDLHTMAGIDYDKASRELKVSHQLLTLCTRRSLLSTILPSLCFMKKH